MHSVQVVSAETRLCYSQFRWCQVHCQEELISVGKGSFPIDHMIFVCNKKEIQFNLSETAWVCLYSGSTSIGGTKPIGGSKESVARGSGSRLWL